MGRVLVERKEWPVLAVLAGSTVVAVHNLIAIVHFAFHRAFEGDFALYYIFARTGLRHGWNSLYDAAAQRQEWQALGSAFFYPALFPPPLAWLAAPFALLPFPMANGLWCALLGVSFLVTWRLLAPGRAVVRATHLTVALALPTVAFGLLLAQVVIVLAAAIAGAWWLMRHQRDFVAGLLLALIALKPQVAFLVPLALLAAGRRPAAAGWLVGSAMLLTAALVTLGPSGLLTYAWRLEATTHALDASMVPVQLTVPGLLGGGLAALLVQGVMTAIMVVLCWRRAGSEFPIAVGLCVSLLVTPYIHPQDITVLLPAGWLYLSEPHPAAERVPAVAGFLAAGLLATPLPLLVTLVAWTVEAVRGRRRALQPAPTSVS